MGRRRRHDVAAHLFRHADRAPHTPTDETVHRAALYIYLTDIYLSDTLTPERSAAVRIFFHLTVASAFAIRSGGHNVPSTTTWILKEFRHVARPCQHCMERHSLRGPAAWIASLEQRREPPSDAASRR